MNISILKKEFFKRKTPIVALELLGKYLVLKYGGKEFAYTVPEVEVYAGHKDRASHARSGMTKRNFIMYGGSGVRYVYLVYGMHEMLNIVTGETDYPAAILIRRVEAVSVPGRVTRKLHIN